MAEPVVLIVFGVFSLVLAYLALRLFRERRLIVHTPTTGAGTILAPGPVEVQGVAERPGGAPELRTPIGNAPCVWYEAVIKQRRTSGSGKNRRTRWVVIDRDRSSEAFLVSDATGRVRVLPEGADVDAHQRAHPRPNSLDELPPQLKDRLPMFNEFLGKLANPLGTVGLRFEERWIPPGANVFVLGTAMVQTAVNTTGHRGWNEVALLKGDAPAFIISHGSEQQLVFRKTLGLAACGVGALACAALGVYFGIVAPV